MLIARRVLKPRGTDAWGDGSYGASRGKKTHRGIDLETRPDDSIYSPVKGRVSKIGYPYAPQTGDEIVYRYVEVTDYKGYRHRVFYIEPMVSVDIHVDTNTVIGTAQDIAAKYSDPGKIMVNHAHYEIIAPDGNYMNPEEFV